MSFRSRESKAVNKVVVRAVLLPSWRSESSFGPRAPWGCRPVRGPTQALEQDVSRCRFISHTSDSGFTGFGAGVGPVGGRRLVAVLELVLRRGDPVFGAWLLVVPLLDHEVHHWNDDQREYGEDEDGDLAPAGPQRAPRGSTHT